MNPSPIFCTTCIYAPPTRTAPARARAWLWRMDFRGGPVLCGHAMRADEARRVAIDAARDALADDIRQSLPDANPVVRADEARRVTSDAFDYERPRPPVEIYAAMWRDGARAARS